MVLQWLVRASLSLVLSLEETLYHPLSPTNGGGESHCSPTHLPFTLTPSISLILVNTAVLLHFLPVNWTRNTLSLGLMTLSSHVSVHADIASYKFSVCNNLCNVASYSRYFNHIYFSSLILQFYLQPFTFKCV